MEESRRRYRAVPFHTGVLAWGDGGESWASMKLAVLAVLAVILPHAAISSDHQQAMRSDSGSWELVEEETSGSWTSDLMEESGSWSDDLEEDPEPEPDEEDDCAVSVDDLKSEDVEMMQAKSATCADEMSPCLGEGNTMVDFELCDRPESACYDAVDACTEVEAEELCRRAVYWDYSLKEVIHECDWKDKEANGNFGCHEGRKISTSAASSTAKTDKPVGACSYCNP